MQKLRRFWEQYFKIRGIISDIKDLVIICGGTTAVTTIVGAGIEQLWAEMSWGYRIPLLMCIFALLFVWIRHIILNRNRIVISNKPALLNALAEFELQARNVFTGKGSSGDDQKACDDLQKETLVANLASGNNPISELIVFATVQIAWKQGKIMDTAPIYYFKTPLEFVGSLRGKAMKARQWIEIISK